MQTITYLQEVLGEQSSDIDFLYIKVISNFILYFKLFSNSFGQFNEQCPSHIEASQLICPADQLTGFYMRDIGC